MKIYLASRYSRREELCGYRDQLEAIGQTVTSRWLTGNHDNAKRPDGTYEPGAARLAAAEDLADIDAAEIVISFTESAPENRTAGRHVEFGYALARGKVMVIVGPPESVFHYRPGLLFFETWDACLRWFFRLEAGDALTGVPIRPFFNVLEHREGIQKMRDGEMLKFSL